MRLPRTYVVIQHLVDGYVALLLALVIVALLVPPVVSARAAARRAVCANYVWQHSGSHSDVVCLKQGRIVGVSSCWCCGASPNARIRFVEEKDGEVQSSNPAMVEGLAVVGEALDRLRRYKLDRRESGVPKSPLSRD